MAARAAAAAARVWAAIARARPAGCTRLGTLGQQLARLERGASRSQTEELEEVARAWRWWAECPQAGVGMWPMRQVELHGQDSMPGLWLERAGSWRSSSHHPSTGGAGFGGGGDAAEHSPGGSRPEGCVEHAEGRGGPYEETSGSIDPEQPEHERTGRGARAWRKQKRPGRRP